MDLALALIAGYPIGSIPTANAIAGLFGIDLRSEGSGNPGANNARHLGGPGLSIAILSVEAAGVLVMLLTLGLLWFPMAWPNGWGADGASLPWLAIGLTVVVAPKHIIDALALRPRTRG